MHKELEDFLEAHDVSELTIRIYRSNLKHYSEWLHENDLHPHDATKRDLKKYKKHLNKAHDYAPKTRRSKFAAVKAYYSAEVEDDILEENPTTAISYSDVAKDETLKEAKSDEVRLSLTEEEIGQLVEHAPSPQLRNRLLILFQYHTGLRREEIAKLKFEHIDREERKVSIEGKAGNQITTYWRPSLDDLLTTWIEKYRASSPFSDESEYLFLTDAGKKITGSHINQIVRQAAERAGIQTVLYDDARGRPRHRVTSHAIRHSFGSHFIKRGGSTEALKEIFAHTDIQTTQQYEKDLEDWVKKEARDFGPSLVPDSEVEHDTCEICDTQANLIDHHYSYYPPKIVEICSSCHTSLHHTNEESEWLPTLSKKEGQVLREKVDETDLTHAEALEVKQKVDDGKDFKSALQEIFE